MVNYLFVWKHNIKEQFPDCLKMFFSHGYVPRERQLGSEWYSNGHETVGSLSSRKGLEFGGQKYFGEKKSS